ncbi:hypothetical protein RU86_GL000222 [Lactococcus piscium]|uniref:Uncharacterized protein n=1 Tax=Pseudolactococcus piscium TaxID=1364 RepID=A0A2A5RZC2_9LACT|nr:hypothetical protein RU86_GL000222 [Lactococcus piscium]
MSKNNQLFVTDFLLTMTGDILLKDETIVQLKLAEVINDIAQAEKDGYTAQMLLGTDPKKVAKAILAAMPNKKIGTLIKENLTLFCITLIFVIFLSSIGIHNINGIDKAYFSIISALLTPLIIACLIFIALKLINFSAFKSRLIKGLCLFICTFGIVYLSSFLFSRPIYWLSFEVPLILETGQLIAVLLYLISLVYYFWIVNKQQKV